MISEPTKVQKSKHNGMSSEHKNISKAKKNCYYAHSIEFYGTVQEQADIRYLKSLKLKVINPNGLGLGRDMYRYLLKVRHCDSVYFRGNTIGVILEVLTAKALNKPVFSLKTRQPIADNDLNNFIDIFNRNQYRNYDILRLRPSEKFPFLPSVEVFQTRAEYDNFLELIGNA